MSSDASGHLVGSPPGRAPPLLPPPPPLSVGDPGPSADPQLVETIVEELKSQGTFDQFRKECLAEVDTKPAFQNLRQRVEGSLTRFLAKESWSPTMNKTQLRNKLRKYIQESSYMDAGVERIVEQVVNPKIYSVIEPEVESVIYNYFGFEKPDPACKSEMQNGNVNHEKPQIARSPAGIANRSPEKLSGKLSNISSEDIEMHSADEAVDKKQVLPHNNTGEISTGTPERSSPAPRGDISPLTPPRRDEEEPLDSPYTPHDEAESERPHEKSPGSPHTPPLPPPRPSLVAADDHHVLMEQTVELAIQEEIIGEEDDVASMSPVSDTELADISPPKQSPETPSESSLPSPPPEEEEEQGEDQRSFTPPLPPPLPVITVQPPPPPIISVGPPPPPPIISSQRPPSPLTSPIGSSPDDMDMDGRTSPKSNSGPSDISDTDLPASQSENEDLEDLERTRADLKAKLEAQYADDSEESEGEIRSESEAETEEYVKKFNQIFSGTEGDNKEVGEGTSPVSDSLSPLAMSKPNTSDDHKSSSESEEEKMLEAPFDRDAQKKKKDEDGEGEGDKKDPSGNESFTGGDTHMEDSFKDDYQRDEGNWKSSPEDKNDESKKERSNFHGFHPNDITEKDRIIQVSEDNDIEVNGNTFGLEDMVWLDEEMSPWNGHLVVTKSTFEWLQEFHTEATGFVSPPAGDCFLPPSPVSFKSEGSSSPSSFGSSKENVEDPTIPNDSKKSKRISNKNPSVPLARFQTRGRRSGKGALQSNAQCGK